MASRQTGRVTVSLRLDPDLLKRLDAAAEERDLGRNALAARLLERGLGQLAPIGTGELRASLRPDPADTEPDVGLSMAAMLGITDYQGNPLPPYVRVEGVEP